MEPLGPNHVRGTPVENHSHRLSKHVLYKYVIYNITF